MLEFMRRSLGPVVVGVVIALIAFVFIFWGVGTPDAGFAGSVVGTVNGERIAYGEYSRVLGERLEFMRTLELGGDAQGESLRQRVREQVFHELVNRRLLIQEAERAGMRPGESEVRDQIRRSSVFSGSPPSAAGAPASPIVSASPSASARVTCRPPSASRAAP